jgi:hypothetical protein
MEIPSNITASFEAPTPAQLRRVMREFVDALPVGAVVTGIARDAPTSATLQVGRG